jgi:hypothetical protein
MIGQGAVTFVLDSVVYWRSSLGMEAWIKTGAVLEEFRAVLRASVAFLLTGSVFFSAKPRASGAFPQCSGSLWSDGTQGTGNG